MHNAKDADSGTASGLSFGEHRPGPDVLRVPFLLPPFLISFPNGERR